MNKVKSEAEVTRIGRALRVKSLNLDALNLNALKKVLMRGQSSPVQSIGRGGLVYWSEHALLCEENLPKILADIEPDRENALSVVLNWAHKPEMRAHWLALSRLVAAKIPEECPLSDAEKTAYVREKIATTVARFSEPWLILAGQSLQAYLVELVDTITEKAQPEQPELRKKLFANIAWSLLLQDVADDPRYTPHDFRHAIVVSQWMSHLANLDADVLQGFASRYGLSAAQAQAVIRVVGVMHDCGYPFMCDSVESTYTAEARRAAEKAKHTAKHEPDEVGHARCCELTKSTHSVISGMLFYRLVRPTLEKIMTYGSAKNGAELCRVMTRAIHLHCSDNPGVSAGEIQVSTFGGAVFQLNSPQRVGWLSRVLTDCSDPIQRVKLYPGETESMRQVRKVLPSNVPVVKARHPFAAARVLDAVCVGDKALATPCVMVDRQKIPLAFWLMLADNLDMTAERLGAVQGSGVFGRLLALQYGEASQLRGERVASSAGSCVSVQPVPSENPSDRMRQMRLNVETLYNRRNSFPDGANWPETPFGALVHASAAGKRDLDFLVGTHAVSKVSFHRDAQQRDKITVELQPVPFWLKGFLSKAALKEKMQLHVKRLEKALSFLKDAPEIHVVWPFRY